VQKRTGSILIWLCEACDRLQKCRPLCGSPLTWEVHLSQQRSSVRGRVGVYPGAGAGFPRWRGFTRHTSDCPVELCRVGRSDSVAVRDVARQTVPIDGDPNVIIGVLPRHFHFAPAGLFRSACRRSLRMSNIIMTTTGSGGDVLPFVTIGRALRSRGHLVTVLTHDYFSQAVIAAGLRFAPLDTPGEWEQMIRDGSQLRGPSALPSFIERHVLPKIASEVGLIRKFHQPNETILVARWGPGFAAKIAAEQLVTRLVGVLMAPAHLIGLPLYQALVASRLGTSINECRAHLGLNPVRHWDSWLGYETGLALWPEWFSLSDSCCPRQIKAVGFVLSHDLQPEPTKTSVSQSSRNGPTILISAGTAFFGWMQHLYSVVLSACGLLGWRADVVCRDREQLPGVLPSYCRHFHETTSFCALMQNASVVCHHGGIGTLGLATAIGVPQLIIASGGDRPDNGDRVQRLGIGESIPLHLATSEGVADALRRIVGSPAIQRRCQELSGRVRNTPTLDLACERIELPRAV
jgi:rhamnosyltransferase subunit B